MGSIYPPEQASLPAGHGLQAPLVFPLHDPGGLMFPRLQAITPILEQNFSRAYILVAAETHKNCQQNIHWLKQKPLFRLTVLEISLSAGDQFKLLYKWASLVCLAVKSFPSRLRR